jgi:hypothetical protein
VIVKVGLAIGMEIETLREKFDRDFDSEQPGAVCLAGIRIVCNGSLPQASQ